MSRKEREERRPRKSSEPSKEIRKRLVPVMVLRIVLITVLLGATLALNLGSEFALADPSARFLLGLVALTYVLSIGWAIWYRSDRQNMLLARTQLITDLVFWGGLTYATGGVASGFTALFGLWVIVWAVVLGGRAAYHAALISSGILVFLGGAMQFGQLTPLTDQLVGGLPLSTFGYFVGVNISALFIVAVLVSSLVRKLEFTGEGLAIERTRRADLAQLHTDMIRSLTVGIATTKMSGEVLTMNPRGLEMLGVDIAEVEDVPLWRWLPELEGQLMPSSTGRSRGRGTVLGPSRTRIPVEYIVAPLTTADGQMQGFIVVFSDLSEVRRLESALEKSRRLAALGELAASLAHEIRNPLGALSGSFQILSMSPGLTEEDASLVDIITREIKRMERLVTDMLDYSRPRKRELDDIDLAALARETAKTFLMDEEAQERLVDVDAPAKLIVKLDGGQMKQVLWNLLRNALQATEPGDRIDVLLRTENGNKTVLEVRDTGYGIDPEVERRIFDPFFSTRERGLGLGLALCQRIVADHRGMISAKSGDMGGTVFRIELPTRG